MASSSKVSKDANLIEFFKIYLPNCSSQHLELPNALTKELNSSLPPRYILACSEKKVWSVGVKKVEDTLYFEKGWSKFVKDNSLEPGDFLMFTYDGASLFSVKIYGLNGCAKTNSQGEEEMSSGKEGNLSSADREISGEYQNKTGGKKKGLQVKSRRRAPETSSRSSSEYPSFKIGMLPVYIRHGSLNIPMAFAREHLGVERVEASLQVSPRSWPVTLTTYPNGCSKISSGWLAFVRDNCVQEGDTCLFELIDISTHTFSVFISNFSS